MDLDDFSGGKFYLSGIPYPAASYLRKGLIVFQFTVSLIFIIGTLVIGRQIHYLLNKDLGFRKDAILILNTPDNDSTGTRIRNVLAEKIRELPGVEEVSVGGQQPAVSNGSGDAYLKRLGNGVEVLADRRTVDAHFIPLYDMKILAGHNLSGRVNDSFPEFVINETCARQLGFKNPGEAIGQSIQIGFLGYSGTDKPTGPVTGVVADFHTRSLYEPIGPVFMTAARNFWREILSVRLATSGKEPGSFKTSISQRTREIGIRKVLGASVSGIVAMLSKEFLQLVFLSIFIASPIAWYFLRRWLQDFAYRVTISWWIFVLAGSGAIAMALITVGFRAIKAAIANPVKSLRTE